MSRVITDSTVKNKPSNCTREHCVIENDTCEGYMGVDFCTLKDNNPSPLEKLNKYVEAERHYKFARKETIRVYAKSSHTLTEEVEADKEERRCRLAFEKIQRYFTKALTNYANMVESLEGLVEKYGTFPFVGLPNYVNRKEVVADITKVLEGKINE